MSHEQTSPSERPILSRDELVVLLDRYDIPYRTWGRNGTKTLEDLLAEVETGEALVDVVEERLVRRITGVALDVFGVIDGVMCRLCEDRQEFVADASVRRRNLSTSLGEKIKPGEEITTTIQRALEEELGVTPDALRKVVIGECTRKCVEATSFPGLLTDRSLTYAAVVLAAGEIQPEGYVEHQPTKDIFFVWRPHD